MTYEEIEAYWLEFERIGRLLQSQEWIFAKTMADNPHWYTLRRKWKTQDEFRDAVVLIRARGYRRKFARSWYVQLDVNDHFYWTMGAPIDYPNGTTCTILINRKPLTVEGFLRVGITNGVALADRVVLYDAIAPQYDTLFDDPASLEENAIVFGLPGDLTDKSVLDVGCGTGLALDYMETAARYLGIDPSEQMLKRLQARHPQAETICTTLASFVPAEAEARYDVVLAVFGTGSYLTDEELGRIPTLLNPGGVAVVMFYAPGYYPETYVRTGVEVPHRAWTPTLFPYTDITTIGGHVCCIFRNDA